MFARGPLNLTMGLDGSVFTRESRYCYSAS